MDRLSETNTRAVFLGTGGGGTEPQSILVAIGTNNLGSGMNAQDTVGGIKAVVKVRRM